MLFFVVTSPAFGWGERGHDIVTRVAVRVVKKRHGDNFAKPFAMKEHMLAHLANVPDIVWRNRGKNIARVNGPTHYINLEYFHKTPAFDNIPRQVKKALERIRSNCKTSSSSFPCPKGGKTKPNLANTGSAPWRIQQFSSLMESSFRDAKEEAPRSRKRTRKINEALLYGGILGHFVGDVANPHHTTRDYDGWEIGQGGIHGYFESDVINALPLGLSLKVLNHTLQKKPRQKLADLFPATETMSEQAINWAFALCANSYARKGELNKIDRKYALLKESSQTRDGVRKKAERRAPENAMLYFESIAIRRLAMAADTLAKLWHLSWQRAGRPDLSHYFSYEYPVEPKFIPPAYMKNTTGG